MRFATVLSSSSRHARRLCGDCADARAVRFILRLHQCAGAAGVQHLMPGTPASLCRSTRSAQCAGGGGAAWRVHRAPGSSHCCAPTPCYAALPRMHAGAPSLLHRLLAAPVAAARAPSLFPAAEPRAVAHCTRAWGTAASTRGQHNRPGAGRARAASGAAPGSMQSPAVNELGAFIDPVGGVLHTGVRPRACRGSGPLRRAAQSRLRLPRARWCWRAPDCATALLAHHRRMR